MLISTFYWMPVNRNTKKVVFSKPSNYNVSVKTTFKSSSDVEILKLKTIDTPKFNFEKKNATKNAYFGKWVLCLGCATKLLLKWGGSAFEGFFPLQIPVPSKVMIFLLPLFPPPPRKHNGELHVCSFKKYNSFLQRRKLVSEIGEKIRLWVKISGKFLCVLSRFLFPPLSVCRKCLQIVFSSKTTTTGQNNKNVLSCVFFRNLQLLFFKQQEEAVGQNVNFLREDQTQILAAHFWLLLGGGEKKLKNFQGKKISRYTKLKFLNFGQIVT